MGKLSDQKHRLDVRVNDIEVAAIELFDGFDRRMNHIQQELDEEKRTRDTREDWILREIQEVKDYLKELTGRIIIIEAKVEDLYCDSHASVWMKILRMFRQPPPSALR